MRNAADMDRSEATMSAQDFYARAVLASPDPTMEGGASGYFSEPSSDLDPNLFEGQTLHPEVRSWITSTLYSELKNLGLHSPGQWAYIWLAGSGVSYQWSADRGNGDLDVLFGVDMPSFARANPDWAGYSDDQLAQWLNEQLKSDLWPRTAHQAFGNQAYEVTFYLNPGTGRDITQIKPYAAYDVRKNQWTVHPQNTMGARQIPAGWYSAAEDDTMHARELVNRYTVAHAELANTSPGSPAWVNAGSKVKFIADAAQSMWDDIHGGRHEAFAGQGHGYGDWHNFRWQYAKQQGTHRALKHIIDIHRSGQTPLNAELYGTPVASASDALQHAAFVNQARPGLR